MDSLPPPDERSAKLVDLRKYRGGRWRPDWLQACIRNAKGDPIPNLANALTAMRADPTLRSIVASGVTIGLTVGEGVETCLSARQLGLRPAWALGSVRAIRTFPVLSGIEALTILEETDDG